MKKHIPNLITLGNLLCGVMASYLAVNGDIQTAALMICAGIFLDFFDGLTARLLNVASPLGKELDSLADVVTSGVAPCMILMHILEQGPNENIAYIALLMPLFAAYRLAKFNLDTRQSHSFLGLPVPANALIWVGLALSEWEPSTTSGMNWPVLAIVIVTIITDILMISELPMFSLKFNFKELSWSKNKLQYIFLLGCAIIIAATRQWYCISVIIVWYILLSIITRKNQHA